MTTIINSDTAAIGLLFLAVLGVLAAGAAQFGLSWYIARRHPDLWRQLGSPRLVFMMSWGYDPMSDWLQEKRYRAINDSVLHRWCPVVRTVRASGLSS